MNTITLKGQLKNIQYSHTINNIDYDKANLIVTRNDGREDVLSLRFKKFSNIYKEDQQIELLGNIRSYSQVLPSGKNKVEIYIFTYFDLPSTPENGIELDNQFELDGRICKLDPIHTTLDGRENIHFILANNIIAANNSKKINNYIPLVCWGPLCHKIAELNVSDRIKVMGQLHSRTYRKNISDGEFEIRTAHEGVISDFERLEG